MEKVLIVSAKKSLGAPLVKPLGKAGLEVCTVSPASLASKIAAQSPHCVLLVLQKLLETDWKHLVEAIRRFDDNLPIIVLSASKEVDAIVHLMKMGIHDYLAWPPDFSKLRISIQNACRLYDLTKRVFLLENRLEGTTRQGEMVGHSPPMQILFQTIQSVAKTNATVLILGESGTGKELVAKAIHRLSPRNNRKFIDINCGAIPRELLENELFGHEKGSYTGADRRYIGCCERADGGTLFLDEISEMDPSLQVKLLRFLQEREFNRVGGSESIKV
ncbi:MAG: sigma 54-interacting transcriptional regulator, partial [bacterium]|nr:sigma 54-interacting transcriptional regulator [bacterium]